MATSISFYHFLQLWQLVLIYTVGSSDVEESLRLLQSPSLCPSVVWSDEFDGGDVSEKWEFMLGDGCDLGICGWGNAEQQIYQAENAMIQNGMLHITANQRQEGGFTSARIRSKADIDLAAGALRLEASIKVPSGTGLWPAFWMMPSFPENAIQLWPLHGEIDIMEFLGRQPHYSQGYMHYGEKWNNKSQRGGPLWFPASPAEDFHVYAIEKYPNRIVWLVDGYVFQEYNADGIEQVFDWPFETPFHFLLNLAVGGDWSEGINSGTKFPATMLIDHVRVYDLSTSPGRRITGPNLVHTTSGQEFCITGLGEDDDITWSVPNDALFQLKENDRDCVIVTFGIESGFVRGTVTSTCNNGERLGIPVKVEAFFGKDASIAKPNDADSHAEYVTSSGSYEISTYGASPVIRYARNIDEHLDFIEYSAPGIAADAELFVSGEKKFYMDVLAPTVAPCTRVYIYLDNRSVVANRPIHSPLDRHSRYVAYIEKSNDWQRLEFAFDARVTPESGTPDSVIVLFDFEMLRSDLYFFRNFDVSAKGCAAFQNCEPLSTNQCRTTVKSEAGACNDGINNDSIGYDGDGWDGPFDCTDPDCWDDPACNSAFTYTPSARVGAPDQPPPASLAPTPEATDPRTLKPTESEQFSSAPSFAPTFQTSIPSFYPTLLDSTNGPSTGTITSSDPTSTSTSRVSLGPSVIEMTITPTSLKSQGPSFDSTITPSIGTSTGPSMNPTNAPSKSPLLQTFQPTPPPTEPPSLGTLLPSPTSPSFNPTVAPSKRTLEPTLPSITSNSATRQPTTTPSSPFFVPAVTPSMRTLEPTSPPITITSFTGPPTTTPSNIVSSSWEPSKLVFEPSSNVEEPPISSASRVVSCFGIVFVSSLLLLITS